MTIAGTPSISDRLLAAFRALVRAEFPQLTFMGTYEYSVQSTDGTPVTPATWIDCAPVDSTLPLPFLSKVPLWGGLMAEGVCPAASSLCLITFINADPTRPICIAMRSVPQFISIANGTAIVNAAARTGDPVLGGGSVIGPGSTKVAIGS